MNYSNIFFDLDGTLTDSKVGIINSVKYSLNKAKVDYSNANLELFIGPPLLNSYVEVLKMSKNDALKAIDYYQEYFSEKGKFENYVYDGIIDLLLALKKSNAKIYMATTKPEFFAKQIAEHFGFSKFFDEITGGTLDQKLAEKDEILALAIKRAKIKDKTTCVMVGDRMHDIIGAQKNGLDCVGVLYGYGSKKELSSYSQTAIIDSVKSLENYLLK